MNRTLQSVRFTLLFLLLALVVAEAWLAITAALYSHQTPGGFANWLGEIKFSFWQLISFQTKPSPRPDNTRMLVVLLGAILVVVAALCLVVRFERLELRSSGVPMSAVLHSLAVGLEAKSLSLQTLSRRLERALPPPETLSASPRDGGFSMDPYDDEEPFPSRRDYPRGGARIPGIDRH